MIRFLLQNGPLAATVAGSILRVFPRKTYYDIYFTCGRFANRVENSNFIVGRIKKHCRKLRVRDSLGFYISVAVLGGPRKAGSRMK